MGNIFNLSIPLSVDYLVVFNPHPARFIYLNFQPLEVVDRYRDPPPQVVENYSYLFNLRPNIYSFLPPSLSIYMYVFLRFIHLFYISGYFI